VAANTVYLGRETGYSPKPLANILLVNSNPSDTNYGGETNFLTQEFLISIGFNVSAVAVTQVKYLNLLKYNAILWTSTDQPNEAGYTTYSDLVNAINNGVGFILVDNAGGAYGGGTGITSTTLQNLFGLTYPTIGCCWIPNNPAPVSNFVYSTSSTVANKILAPYASLSLSDMMPYTPKAYLYQTTSAFTANGGIVIAQATDTDNGQAFATIVALNGTGPGHGRMLWLGTTYDTSGLYGSYVSGGLWTRQLDLYVNMLLYASKEDSLIPYIYSDSVQLSFYPGITFSILGNNDGKEVIWFSDFTHTAGGTSTINIDYNFRASALGLNGNWIALNLANMAVVNEGNSLAVGLPMTMQNETWAPVYVSNLTPTNLGLVYANSVVGGQIIGSYSATYVLSGPPDSGSWLIVKDSSPPSSVAAGGAALTQYSSLGGLVSATQSAYMQTNANNWTPASGWYFDPTHQLLYAAYVGGPSVSVAINQPSSTSSTTTSTTTTTTSSSTTTSTTTTTTAPFSFALSASPSSGSVLQGGSISTGVYVQLLSGPPQPVSVAASKLPAGALVSFSLQNANPSFVSTMTLTTSPSTPPGTYSVPITATSGQLTQTVNYTLSVSQQRYSLVVTSQPSQGGTTDPGPGTYSYPAGSSVTIKAVPSAGWLLSRWDVNGANSGNGSSITIIVAEYTTVEAVFAQVVAPTNVATVSIRSAGPSAGVVVDGKAYTLPVRFDWMVGSNHTISVPTVTATANQTRTVFLGWSGSTSSGSPSVDVRAYGNMELVANYRVQYLTTFGFVDENGLSLKPSNVVLEGQGGPFILPSNQSVWLNSGAKYTVVQALWMGSNVISSVTFTADNPGLRAVPLLVYSDTVRVVDIYGLPIGGAMVEVSAGNGIQLVRTTGSNGSVTFAQIPLGNYYGTVTYIGLSSGISVLTPGNNVTTVSLVLDYPVITSLMLFGLMLGLLAYRRRRRDSLDVADSSFQ